jgi:hypothetical protein
MRQHRFTETDEDVLRSQAITADRPGPVLHDFEVLLDAVGPDGVESGGKYHLIPIRLIDELDRRLSRPLRLELKRPQVRSHPYLQGLNLLLRATGLARVEGKGSKTRLALDPFMKEQWDGLNPTERYFNLLEAWLRFGRPEMVRETGGWLFDGFLHTVLTDWTFIPERGHKFQPKRPGDVYLMGTGRAFYQVALANLFGLLAVDQPRAPVSTWFPAAIRPTRFGDAVFARLDTTSAHFNDEDEAPPDGDEDLDEGEEGLTAPRFGAWQRLFQPYFPEWVRNLELPRAERREGEFVFRVCLGKVWRLIAVPSDAPLDELAEGILRSVKFDSDHLYEFIYHDPFGTKKSVFHPEMDEGPWADEVSVGDLPLEPGQSMTFHFDFGDDWLFDVRLERVAPPGSRKHAVVVERHGKAPPQYPGWDE